MAAGVSLLSDLPYSNTSSSSSSNSSAGNGGDINTDMERDSVRVPTAKYTKMGETLRHVIPGHMQCSMACGGRACKYENPSRWSDEEQAIKGLYSSWITDNLLAMARPSTEIIEKYDIINQFLRYSLKTVINLQRPGEHASCGYPLEPASGFTYRPEVFMEAGIYFYNFGWKDYGVASLTTILDMVKVMSFAMQEGKMAIHCHAGLGRTGVLLACYLVFTSRMSADQAILFVRAKRPNSIQTRGQLLCVREFARFLVPLRSVFSSVEPKTHTVTLSQFLTRQRHLLHGYEARQMKNVPKIVHLVCRLLLDIAENRQTVEEEAPEIPDLTAEVEKTVSQQALQQLGKELRGKGIPVLLSRCSEPSASIVLSQRHHLDDQLPSGHQEFKFLWQRQCLDHSIANANKPRLLLNCGLSASDSALHTLDSRWQQLAWPPMLLSTNRCISQNRLAAESPDLHSSRLALTPESCSSPKPDLTGSFTSLEEPKKEQERTPRSPVFRRRVPLKETKRSRSLGFSGSSTTTLSVWQTEECRDEAQSDQGDKKPFRYHGPSTEDSAGKERESNVPFIMLQTELTPEARRVLVAKALAMDIDAEGLSDVILAWQTELNSREGAWERLCLERDPLVLSALMWSWLEQLKEPILTEADIEMLTGNSHSPQNALNTMDKGHRQTLLCILDCAAHLMKLPEEVETAVLNHTIKAFTGVTTDSENGQMIYKALQELLILVLDDLRRKAVEAMESP
ncbi:protein tyrosine phosphatase domain-containing protein 1 [Pygocentrus nattereri]|uniref:Protein tyrosine phosphatase domain-containing protein 1 n=1 Tax=Pygocentrus nattereri TaxID=42514 RepID=A0A3B4BL86_PYGNA|nr:protein tyrosine phosphatase domain-containing protein 1 [Pygocentrus nattereri]